VLEMSARRGAGSPALLPSAARKLTLGSKDQMCPSTARLFKADHFSVDG
jgi:hypothetical protein